MRRVHLGAIRPPSNEPRARRAEEDEEEEREEPDHGARPRVSNRRPNARIWLSYAAAHQSETSDSLCDAAYRTMLRSRTPVLRSEVLASLRRFYEVRKTADVEHASNRLRNVDSLTDLQVGMLVTGPGCPQSEDVRVLALHADGRTVELTRAAIESAEQEQFTFLNEQEADRHVRARLQQCVSQSGHITRPSSAHIHFVLRSLLEEEFDQDDTIENALHRYDGDDRFLRALEDMVIQRPNEALFSYLRDNVPLMEPQQLTDHHVQEALEALSQHRDLPRGDIDTFELASYARDQIEAPSPFGYNRTLQLFARNFQHYLHAAPERTPESAVLFGIVMCMSLRHSPARLRMRL